jgi:hypothetical protein
MKQHNFVAKHMNSFNRASVVPDKRDKYLEDAYEKEMEGEFEDDENDYIPD